MLENFYNQVLWLEYGLSLKLMKESNPPVSTLMVVRWWKLNPMMVFRGALGND